MSTITARLTTAHPSELAWTPSGTPVLEVSAAENYSRKNRHTGEWEQYGTGWFRVKAFGKTAENMAEALTAKGQQILVTGRLELRDYETRDGKKGISVEILADTIALIPRSGFTSAPQTASNGYQAPAPTGGSQGDPWATSEEAPF